MSADHDESAFVLEILSDPGNAAARAVYADWLEERGDARAEVLRIESEMAHTRPGSEEFRNLQSRLRRARRGINQNWIVVVTRVAIENCPISKRNFCPGRWERLEPTHLADLRMCWECEQQVNYCNTMRDAQRHVRMRRPIAVSLTLQRNEGDLSSH